MTLIAPAEVTVVELEDMFDRHLKCHFVEEFDPDEMERCQVEATHLIIERCGHNETMCEEHAIELSYGGQCTICDDIDWNPKVVLL